MNQDMNKTAIASMGLLFGVLSAMAVSLEQGTAAVFLTHICLVGLGYILIRGLQRRQPSTLFVFSVGLLVSSAVVYALVYWRIATTGNPFPDSFNDPRDYFLESFIPMDIARQMNLASYYGFPEINRLLTLAGESVGGASYLANVQFSILGAGLLGAYMYHLALRFLPKRGALTLALATATGCATLAYSTVLLRDIWYAVAIVHLTWSFDQALSPERRDYSGVLMSVIYLAFLFYLRPPTGAAVMLLLILGAVLAHFRYLVGRPVMLVAVLVLVGIGVGMSSASGGLLINGQILQRTVQDSSAVGQSLLDSGQDSLGAMLVTLPVFLRVPVQFAWLHVLPFPFYTDWVVNSEIQWISVLVGIGALLNSLVLPLYVLALLRVILTRYKRLVLPMVMVIGYMLAASLTVGTNRYVFPVFPLLWLFAAWEYTNLRSGFRRGLLALWFGLLITLYVVYVGLKAGLPGLMMIFALGILGLWGLALVLYVARGWRPTKGEKWLDLRSGSLQ